MNQTPKHVEKTMGLIETFNAVKEIMGDCSWWKIDDIVPEIEMDTSRMQKQPCEHPFFDHEYIDQKGPGISGDDYSGYIYFPLQSGVYLQVEYST